MTQAPKPAYDLVGDEQHLVLARDGAHLFKREREREREMYSTHDKHR